MRQHCPVSKSCTKTSLTSNVSILRLSSAATPNRPHPTSNVKTFALSLAIGVAFAWPSAISAQQEIDQKSDLEILLVGHDPAAPYINYEPTERMVALFEERTGAYESFLKQHFTEVTVVFANDYEVAMSNGADVTIFDAKPRVLIPADNVTSYFPQLLPDDFSKPALMIGEVSADIGLGSRLKLDWL